MMNTFVCCVYAFCVHGCSHHALTLPSLAWNEPAPLTGAASVLASSCSAGHVDAEIAKSLAVPTQILGSCRSRLCGSDISMCQSAHAPMLALCHHLSCHRLLLCSSGHLAGHKGAGPNKCDAHVQQLAETLSPFDGVVTNNVLPVLKLLTEDSDHDVRFFASQALQYFTE